MKKFPVLILAIAVIASAGCGFKNNTLAVYDGGMITGGDLTRWLDDMEIPSGEIFNKENKNKQQIYLRRIALERLQMFEIKKIQYDLNPEIIKRIAEAERNFIAEYFRRRFRGSCEFNEDAVKAEIIRLKIKSSKTAVEGSEDGRIVRRLKINAVKNMELRLAEEPDVISYIDHVTCSGKGLVLFKIGDMEFNCGDLDKVIESGEKNRRGMGLAPKVFDQKRTRLVARRIFRDRLLEREARRRGIDRDEKYIRQWEHVRNSILFSFYVDEVLLQSLNVSGLNVPGSEKSGELRKIDKHKDFIRKQEQRLLDENHFNVI